MQTIKGTLTSHWWIVTVFVIVAVVVVYFIYSEVYSKTYNKNVQQLPVVNLTTPKIYASSTPAITTNNPAPAWDVTKGDLPTNSDQAQYVLLYPSSTPDQILAAQNIQAGAGANEFLNSETTIY